MLKDDLNLLIAYAKKNLKLEGLNEIYVRNTLMKKFNIEEEYYDTDTSIVNDLVRPDILIEKLSKDLIDSQLFKDIVDFGTSVVNTSEPATKADAT